MGIEPMEPGFGKIRIKPQAASLQSASIKCPTIRGDILVSFLNDPQKTFELSVVIPANTTADIYLPQYNQQQSVQQNSHEISFTTDGNYAVIKKVGSGKNVFKVSR